jgi:hypothetical protein
MAKQYLLNLTNGAYVVDEANAATVCSAIADSHPFVDICADLIGDGFLVQTVRLFTQHLISIVPVGPERASADAEATDGETRRGDVIALIPRRVAR